MTAMNNMLPGRRLTQCGTRRLVLERPTMDPGSISSLQLIPGLLKTAQSEGLMQDSLGLLQTAVQPQSLGLGLMHQGTSLGHPAVLLLTPL